MTKDRSMTKRQRAAAENNWRQFRIAGAESAVYSIINHSKGPPDEIYLQARVALTELRRLKNLLKEVKHDTVS